jgi:colanic acid biosynthesis protein WcaH
MIIPEKLYKQIVDTMPIPCVDVVISNDSRRVLLIRRSDEPAKGKWWVIGGRIHKKESLVDAAIRKVRDETGLEVKIIKKLDFYEYTSDQSEQNSKTGTHSVIVGLHVKLKHSQKVNLDKTSSEYKWIGHIEEDLDPYVKQILRDSRIFS